MRTSVVMISDLGSVSKKKYQQPQLTQSAFHRIFELNLYINSHRVWQSANPRCTMMVVISPRSLKHFKGSPNRGGSSELITNDKIMHTQTHKHSSRQRMWGLEIECKRTDKEQKPYSVGFWLKISLCAVHLCGWMMMGVADNPSRWGVNEVYSVVARDDRINHLKEIYLFVCNRASAMVEPKWQEKERTKIRQVVHLDEHAATWLGFHEVILDDFRKCKIWVINLKCKLLPKFSFKSSVHNIYINN